MELGIFSSLVGTLMTIHALLYNPVFEKFPEKLYEPSQFPPLTLSKKEEDWQGAPKIFAQAAIVIDQNSAEILFAQNPDLELEPASTTKMMTALLVLEKYDLTKIASVSSGLAQDGSGMGLIVGEQIAIKDLLAGLLVPSANDAADQLSRLHPGGTEGFVTAMNVKAKQLHLQHTNYKNPTGYEDPEHVTTVRDLAILAREAMKNEEFSKLVSLPSLTVFSRDQKIAHQLQSTNELLGKFEGIEGIKTGWTQVAGECFVAQASRGNETYIVVVLNSPDRFREARTLLEWSFSNYSTESVSVLN